MSPSPSPDASPTSTSPPLLTHGARSFSPAVISTGIGIAYGTARGGCVRGRDRRRDVWIRDRTGESGHAGRTSAPTRARLTCGTDGLFVFVFNACGVQRLRHPAGSRDAAHGAAARGAWADADGRTPSGSTTRCVNWRVGVYTSAYRVGPARLPGLQERELICLFKHEASRLKINIRPSARSTPRHARRFSAPLACASAAAYGIARPVLDVPALVDRVGVCGHGRRSVAGLAHLGVRPASAPS